MRSGARRPRATHVVAAGLLAAGVPSACTVAPPPSPAPPAIAAPAAAAPAPRTRDRRTLAQATADGDAAARGNRPAEALAAYARAVELDPRDPRLWNNRGQVHARLAQWAAAVADYDRGLALTRDPAARSTLLSNRGHALRQLGREAEALAAYAEAIDLDPENAEAHYNRGVLYYEQSKRARFGERRRLCQLAMDDVSAACDLGDDDGCKAADAGLDLNCRLVME